MTPAQGGASRWTAVIGKAAVLGLAGLLAGIVAAGAEGRDPLKIPDAQYEPTSWAAIDGWAEDDHDAALAAFRKSCKAILRGPPASRRARPMAAALAQACLRAAETDPNKPGAARAFFEQNFHPVRIAPLGTPEGFVTGYYEPIAEGRREPGDGYDHPLYRKPPNLLPGGRMAVSTVVTVKKKKVRRRKFVPYYERAAIDDGILDGRDLEICWLKDPIDAFFAHIQGSVRVRLDDGRMMRLNYEAANGQPYYPVGRWLIEQKLVSKDDMSMDRIRQWMERNPEQGEALRRKNKSYVFFRETRLASGDEPVGAEGVPLTPGRSVAVDRHLHVYGTPFFISARLPIESEKPETPFRRLMIAQDTGGAIVGPARADIYFGAGDEAGSISGRLRHEARFVMLVPNALDGEDGGAIPLPRPRPSVAVADQGSAVKTADAVGDAVPKAAAGTKTSDRLGATAAERKRPAKKHTQKRKHRHRR